MPTNFLDLHIVDFCQLHCQHCYLNKGITTMPLEMISNLCTDFLQAGFPLPQNNIILSGGDPLLHPQFRDVCDCIRSSNGRISLSTNGILVPNFVALFRPNDCIQISIDGDEATHDFIRGPGSYQKAVEALKCLNEKKIPHTISFTLSKQNMHCVDHVIELCAQTGAAHLNFNLYQPIQNQMLDPVPFSHWIHLRQYAIKKLESHNIMVPKTCLEEGCIAGILGISVLPDGTYWDCSRNQVILGKYPQKIRDILFWDLIRSQGTREQASTCCRRSDNG